MKRINIKSIRALLAIGMVLAGNALWSGCGNDETLTDKTPDTEIPSPKKTGFTFQLSGMGTNARAITDAATEAEKEIKTLYVAFFYKDEADETQSRLENIYVYDTDVTSGDGFPEKRKITQADGSYTISKPGTVGSYLAYFIANPDEGLKTELATYQESTVEGGAPTTLGTFESELKTGNTSGSLTTINGLIMVSSKESIEIQENNGVAKEIKMTRLAARFDFINTQPTLVTITSVKFVNEPVQSVLIPQETATPEAYLTSSTTAKSWNETAQDSHTMTVYTYENLNSNTDGNLYYTAIDIAYSIDLDGKGDQNAAVNKTLRIDLKEQNVPLAVLRNHLYRIYLNCVTGIYAVSVEDWTSSTTVTIPNSSLAITYKETDLGKIGDYVYVDNNQLLFVDGGLRNMYLDGSLVWADNFTPVLPTDKGKCIGLVFSNMTSEKDKGYGFEKGYIISPKDIGSYCYNENGTVTGLSLTTSRQMVYNDLDGYSYSQTIKQNNGGNFDGYPAFLAASSSKDLVDLSNVKGTSGWYLPSTGQLFQFFVNLGNATNLKSLKNDAAELFPVVDNKRKDWYILGSATTFTAAINAKLAPLGTGNFSPIQALAGTGTSTTMSTCNIYDNKHCCPVNFGHGGNQMGLNRELLTTQYGVFPVFAF